MRLAVMVAQLREYTKTTELQTYGVNFMVRELCLNKAVI